VAAALSVTTDYRVRGVSLSGDRPALSVGLSDDLANGAYLGASAIVQDAQGSQAHFLGHQEYAGYARRLSGGATWEVGLDNQQYEGYGATPFHLDYSEVYFGLSGGRLSGRFYYSPNYNGSDHNAAYLEANAAFRPADGWRITGHVGVFQALNPWRGVSMKPRYDGRFEVVRRLGPAEFSLAWAAASPHVGADPKRSSGTVILGAAVFF
jgi:uncharacterized protein (TIGR02001 family)